MFEQTYRCYPLSQDHKSNPEIGDKILMPASALDHLVLLPIDYPMLFELKNPSTGHVSHCGVLQFTAEEGTILMPNWVMDNMKFQEGGLVIITNVSLKKATYVKLQPHTMGFVEISDPKAVLETTLRNHSCLTVGDTIMVMHNGNKFYIDVLETKPSFAVSIIETDCEVDFATPLDYKEKEEDKEKEKEKEKEKPIEEQNGGIEGVKFVPFVGTARRLDGNSCSKYSSSENNDEGLISKKAQAPSSSAKLVFGGSTIVAKSSKELRKGSGERTLEKEVQSFQPFSGKCYKLLG
ncbi:ubiquitin fusion degradation 1 [Quillaja saponaria]|uniref:Ubiquitin fusion degradation 1 n=1 Tax=Quillaja saponaria TaxID=32244 RepID=A0AAD7LUX1_QUISA|nr:ubiquitin fusion degradation 1 [Quillaja saponaria]